MGRSSQHKEKHRKRSGIAQDHHDEGTAARTRPLSFDEIISERKKKKKLFDDEKGAIEDIALDRNTLKVSERDNGRGKGSSPGVQKHLHEGDVKASSKKKEENTSMKDDNLTKSSNRRIRDSETKPKPTVDKDLKNKGRTEEKLGSRRKSNEQLSSVIDTEALDKHSRTLIHDRHINGSRGKSDIDNKRKDQNGIDEKNRDRYPARRHDLRERHVSETLDRKERKDHPSKSRYEELKPKRRWSRSQEGVDRNRRSISPLPRSQKREGVDRKRRSISPLPRSQIQEGVDRNRRSISPLPRSQKREGVDRRRSVSPLPRSQKRASYHSREQDEELSYSCKGKSERQHPHIDRSKNTNNGSSSQHKRHSGSTSGLGGYSPRKRRTEEAAGTPSPIKCSLEKKSAKWDFVPKGSHTAFSVPVPSNFQLLQKTLSLSMHEAVSAVPAPSIMVKPLSGVPYNILSINKNDSVDSVHLTQATRPMRRLYVENIPASASEKALMEFLNNFLISSGVNHIKGTQPCISCTIHREKGQALVEFLTPEDASAALSFDGSFFSGSIIKIRRPKDFVELATGEPEKSVTAVDSLSNTVQDSPHKIFIGGISKTLSSKMIMEIASAFGPLKAHHFESCDINESHAFLEYADQSVTFRACAGLNGMKLGGQVITVLQVDPNASTLESSANQPFYEIPDCAKPLLKKPTPVLKLKNLFDQETVPSLFETEIEEVLEDVRLECIRFGTVKSVNIVKFGSASSSTLEACGENGDMELAGIHQNLERDEKNAKTETAEEATDCAIAEGNRVENDKHAPDVMGDESDQPGRSDSNIPESQEHAQQTSKVVLGSSDDKVIRNIHMKDSSAVDELPIGGDLTLEQIGGDLKEGLVDDHVTESDAIEQGHREDQNCDAGNLFEAGCVLVEFGRAEASCNAAHCLHGRLFDNRTVTVEYFPLDIYRSRFPK